MLLHACCGPCSLEPSRLLREEGWQPHIYFANSNIHPADEYVRRLETLRAWAESEGIPVVEGPYDPAAWEASAGRIGEAAKQESPSTSAFERGLE
ncbi:MAG: epoxyqueuosine reductase QueH, partial [Eggerthellaceae bacterium]|nr:epoxyqueuosine reductase QueH [Eggerthellaceae bacterium]